MSFQPTIPLGGVAGWTFLKRTLATQKSAHAASSQLDREATYFREKISSVRTAADLVADRTLLKVSLGAFGLQDDLPNRFFIQKVLEGGTLSTDSLANKLSDPRYAALAKAFGFGDFATPRTVLSTFPDEIVSAYRDKDFELAVGEVDGNLRLALSLDGELSGLVKRSGSADARWYGVMGSPPLRQVFQTALGLPDSFAGLDIDQQLVVFRQRAEAVFGVSEVADFTDPAMTDRLRTRFLVMAEAQNGGMSAARSPVLSLLSGDGTAGGVLAALYPG